MVFWFSPKAPEEMARILIRLLNGAKLREEIGREARRTVERSFSSTTFAEETYKVYKQSLNNSC